LALAFQYNTWIFSHVTVALFYGCNFPPIFALSITTKTHQASGKFQLISDETRGWMLHVGFTKMASTLKPLHCSRQSSPSSEYCENEADLETDDSSVSNQMVNWISMIRHP
jgi:hypothetical protein